MTNFLTHRSLELCKISRDRGFAAFVADNSLLPFRSDSCDAVISIAVLHHFSTPERRLGAVEELLRIVRKGGLVLVTVWALEQREKYDAARAVDLDGEEAESPPQDFLVPWRLQKAHDASSNAGNDSPSKNSKQSKQTRRKNGAQAQDVATSAADSAPVATESGDNTNTSANGGISRSFHRFYHLFCKNELDDLFVKAGAEIVATEYDHDNHYVVARKV